MMTFNTFSLFPEPKFRALRLFVSIHLCLQLCLSAADLARAMQVVIRGYGNPSMLVATGFGMCFVLLFSVLRALLSRPFVGCVCLPKAFLQGSLEYKGESCLQTGRPTSRRSVEGQGSLPLSRLVGASGSYPMHRLSTALWAFIKKLGTNQCLDIARLSPLSIHGPSAAGRLLTTFAAAPDQGCSASTSWPPRQWCIS